MKTAVQDNRQKTAVGTQKPPTLQRKCACGKPITANGECAECQKKRRKLQRKAVNPAGTPEVAPPIVHEVLRQPGRPLDPATRAFMESRFGHAFGHVRVHTSSMAAKSTKSVNALAYTVGQNIVFAPGMYAPRTAQGKSLLAHELTHTIQQAHMPSRAAGQLPIDPSPSLETEATRAATTLKGDASLAPISPVVQRACGPSAIGSVGGCVGIGGENVGTLGLDSSSLYLFNVNCDDMTTSEEARLRQFAASLPNGHSVEVHGFASEEGNMTFNDNLSCARAMSVAAILRSEGLNVTQIFNHGATPGERTIHRSVVVTTNQQIPETMEEVDCGDLIDRCDFYTCREKKHPCGSDGYYLEYGYKYCQRFSQLEKVLSPSGKDWIRRTRRCLMEHIDQNLPEQSNCATVKQSAFDSHPDCYVTGGICFLHPQEWMQIIDIIDSSDNDLKQTLLTGISCFANWGSVGLFPQHSLGAGGGYRGLMERDRQRLRRQLLQNQKHGVNR